MKIGMKGFLGTLGAAVAGLAFAIAPASAQGAGLAVFSGATGTLSGTGVLLVGGAGGYTFSTANTNPLGVKGACAQIGADADDVSTPGDDTGLCTLSASGNYTNIVCGTGTAPGSATVTEGAEQFTSTNYTLIFVAGQGVTVNVGGVSDNEGNSGSDAGYVNITPVVGNCATGPVTEFQASGVVLVVAA